MADSSPPATQAAPDITSESSSSYERPTAPITTMMKQIRNLADKQGKLDERITKLSEKLELSITRTENMLHALHRLATRENQRAPAIAAELEYIREQESNAGVPFEDRMMNLFTKRRRPS